MGAVPDARDASPEDRGPQAEARSAAREPDRAGTPRHLYIHVPFCRTRCDYCDFYSVPVGRASELAGAGTSLARLLDRYVDAVLAEWELERATAGLDSVVGLGRAAGRHLHSVYVGGGTPSLLGTARLERVLNACDALVTPRAEVTVETNPEDVTEGYARWAARRGLRISLGAQSLVPRLRSALGRRAQADPAVAFSRLRAAGCANIGIDLIFGAPGQTMADLTLDLAAVKELRPEHVSWYELDVAHGTALAVRLAEGTGRVATSGVRPGSACATEVAEAAMRPNGDARAALPPAQRPDSDARAAMYSAVVRGLERLGYCWYEVSNFAAPGRRCRHNSAVWRGEDYLGLGAGAVSTLGAQRRRNAPDVEAYLAALAPAAFAGNGRRPAASRGNGRGGAALAPSAPPRQSGESSGKASAGSSVAPACEAPPGSPVAPPRDVERLAAAERARERLYLAARTGAATPLRDLQGVLDSQAVQPLEEAGFVRVAGGTLRVTRKGRYVADEVCVRLFRASCVRGTEEVPQGAAYGTAPQETA